MRSVLVAVLALTAVSTSVLAQAPDSLGAALDTTVGMTFKLYKDGSAVWTETHASVVVTGGIFNVLLGGTTPLDTMAFNAPLEVGITGRRERGNITSHAVGGSGLREGPAGAVHVLSRGLCCREL